MTRYMIDLRFTKLSGVTVARAGILRRMLYIKLEEAETMY